MNTGKWTGLSIKNLSLIRRMLSEDNYTHILKSCVNGEVDYLEDHLSRLTCGLPIHERKKEKS